MAKYEPTASVSLDFQIDDEGGAARRIPVTDAFTLDVQQASQDTTPLNAGQRVMELLNQYGMAAFDAGAFADDAPAVAPPAMSGITTVINPRPGTVTSRTVTITLENGLSFMFEAIVTNRKFNINPSEFVKQMVTLQPTGALTVTI